MHIKKSLSKKRPEKQMSATMGDRFAPNSIKLTPLNSIKLTPLNHNQVKYVSQLQKKPARLPPRLGTSSNIRKTSTKLIQPLQSARKETETTLSESSMMFQSMYGKEWLRPSDYAKEIGQLNLLGEASQMQKLEINLGQRIQRNLERFARLKDVTQKWVQVLRKALSYLSSARAASDKLIEQIKFWKILSRKFDELEYEFNDNRATALLAIMRKFLKTEPQFRPLLEQFLSLKEEIIKLTPAVKVCQLLRKKLYLQLEEVVSGFILKLEQCSDVRESAELLRKILLGFQAITQENQLLRSRDTVIFEKIEASMAQKLVATSLYPRQLANISSVKENYQVIDRALSFYSQLLGSLEERQQEESLINRAEHVRLVLANLLQILSYFQHLYHAREVNEFSKLFSHPLDFNIYDPQYASLWSQYMELVANSMDAHHFEA